MGSINKNTGVVRSGGSGMGSIHKQDLKMEKFLSDIGNIKTTKGENTSNIIKNEGFKSGLAEGAANIMSSATISSSASKVIADAVNKMNAERLSTGGITGKGEGATYKSGELEKTASGYTEIQDPADH